MLERKIRSYTLYELLFFILAYSLLGWIVETTFAFFYIGHFVDRGFLYSPFCPIYGTSMVLVLLALDSVKKNIPALFVGGGLMITAIEYITGVILLEIFGKRWWDYRMFKFNLDGHVTLLASLIWGAALVIIVRFIHPEIMKLVLKIDKNKGRKVMAVIYAILLIDLIVNITRALMTLK